MSRDIVPTPVASFVFATVDVAAAAAGTTVAADATSVVVASRGVSRAEDMKGVHTLLVAHLPAAQHTASEDNSPLSEQQNSHKMTRFAVHGAPRPRLVEPPDSATRW